jgi:hypothetical protein
MKLTRTRFLRISLPAALCFLLSALLCAAALAQTSTKPITRNGLEKAIKLGGLQDSELVGQIEARGVDFVLTDQIRQELQTLGASAVVLKAVGANYRGAAQAHSLQPPPASPKPAPVGSVYPTVPGVYFQVAGSWVPVPQESVEWQKDQVAKGLKKITGGRLATEVTGELAGSHSATSIHAPAAFLVRTAPAYTIDDFLIVHLHGVKHDNRETKVSAGQLHSKDEVAFRAEKLSDRVWQLSFSQGQGDYAFLPRQSAPDKDNELRSGFIYTFQIVP